MISAAGDRVHTRLPFPAFDTDIGHDGRRSSNDDVMRCRRFDSAAPCRVELPERDLTVRWNEGCRVAGPPPVTTRVRCRS